MCERLKVTLSIGLCAVALAGILLAGCESQNPSTAGTQMDKSARLDPGNIPGAIRGIRVNGTEVNPTYGYINPKGDTVCCWPTLEEAELAARQSLKQK